MTRSDTINENLDNDPEEELISGFSVDLYGIKGRIEPERGGEDPKSWKDVAEGVNYHLKRVVLDISGLAADTLSAARAIIQGAGNLSRGLTRIPESLADRIRNAHTAADNAEIRERKYVLREDASPSAEHAAERLVDKLMELRASGLHADIRELRKGFFVITVVPPNQEEFSERLAENVLLEADDEFREAES